MCIFKRSNLITVAVNSECNSCVCVTDCGLILYEDMVQTGAGFQNLLTLMSGRFFSINLSPSLLNLN